MTEFRIKRTRRGYIIQHRPRLFWRQCLSTAFVSVETAMDVLRLLERRFWDEV